MKLVTVATHKERYFPYLELSASQNGHELVKLGWGQKWKGFAWRWELLRDYLKSIPGTEIVCFVDAYDILILQGPAFMEARFKEAIGDSKDAILISQDRSSAKGGMYYLTNALAFQTCGGKYINAGTYMGYASAILASIDDLCSKYSCEADKNDQLLLQKYCDGHRDRFIIDESSSVFLVIANFISKIDTKAEHVTFVDKKLKYKDVFPCVLHGTSNADMDDIIAALGYPSDLYRARNEDKYEYVRKIILDFIKDFWISLTIIVACILAAVFHKRIYKIATVYRWKKASRSSRGR
jgi:hypothetical protein